MPATAARAQFIRQEFRSVSTGPDAAVVTGWGALARRTTDQPIESFFEVEADAQALCDERMSLLSPARRRISASVSGETTGLTLGYIGTAPTAAVIDDDRELVDDMIVVELVIDFGEQKTGLQTWGGGDPLDARRTSAGDTRVTDTGDPRAVSD